MIEDFGSARIDELHTVYTDFRSSFTFRATDKRFLPIAPEEVGGRVEGQPHPEYIFEPEPAEILDDLLPQYLVTKVYFALLESAASENAARQRAMAAATDNADELIKVLTRQANRARQDEITTEIMEIVGGAEALAQASGGGVKSDAREAPDESEPRETAGSLRVIGPVVDVGVPARRAARDPHGADASTSSSRARRATITCEVAQHIGDGMVRAIALKPTDGMVRGAPV